MFIRILDLDGGVTAQREFVDRSAAAVVPMQDWGPSIRICCSFPRFRRFERELANRLADEIPGPAISFCGSGDFHHVTIAFLRRLQEPFNLLVLDKHPDWMRGAPLMHCGTWAYHALRLPNLQRLFHLGGDLDFDNWLRWFAPWRLLREGRIKVVPGVRRFTRGRWRSIPCEPLRADPDRPVSAERLERLCGSFRTDLARFPLYISIDKDVMQMSDSLVNWDSGYLELREVQSALTWFIKAAVGRVIGIDVSGDWSRSRTQGILRSVLNITEHHALRVHPQEAAAVNGRANQALIKTIGRAITPSIPLAVT